MSQNATSINYRLGSLYSVITAFLYATQEPFSFPAAKHLNTLQFVALTQVSLLVSLPLLLSRSKSRRDFARLDCESRSTTAIWELSSPSD